MQDHEPPRPWTVCSQCRGEGRQRKRLSKKARLKRAQSDTPLPIPTDRCQDCQGSGLRLREQNDTASDALSSQQPPLKVAIVGGGLAGLALAAACQHRGIAVSVYERDAAFHQRQQGYGLTMQQAAPQLQALGISSLPAGITSTKHIVHGPDGDVKGEWGMRKWLGEGSSSTTPKGRRKRQNVHIARQALRYELFRAATRAALGSDPVIHWNHRLVNYQEMEDHVQLTLHVENDRGETQTVKQNALLLVGCDGIRSQVRQQLLGNTKALRYLGCIVILGICSLGAVGELRDPSFAHLLDGETVFQTADGTTRIYMMPYSGDEYMWQLSFPFPEEEATALSAKGPAALQDEAIRRCGWHSPVPEILAATPMELLTGYPVYDRAMLEARDLKQQHQWPRRVTLVGDAAHPMSPFKGKHIKKLARIVSVLFIISFLTADCSSYNRPGGESGPP